jgi:ATP-binding protein involved in chromosome partitioning
VKFDFKGSDNSLEKDLLDKLNTLKEPLSGFKLSELGMLSGARVDLKGVEIQILIPGKDYDYASEIESQVVELLSKDYAKVECAFEEMTEDAKESFYDFLVSSAPNAAELPKTPFLSKNTRVIAVSSGKGGVGKSTLSANLAVAIKEMGYKVGLLDADIYGFSIPQILGIKKAPFAIRDILIPSVAWGIKCVSIGFFVNDDQPVIWRGPMLHKSLSQLVSNVYWQEPDFLIVDMPPGTGDVALSMAEFLPSAEFFIVTTPQEVSLRVAKRAGIAAKSLKQSVRGVIENLSYFETDDGKTYELFGQGAGDEIAKNLGVNLLGKIPVSPELRQKADEGVPLVISEENKAAQAIIDVARQIVDMGPLRIYKSELKIKSG